MTVQLKSALSRATPIVVLDAASFQSLRSKLPKPAQNWLAGIGFTAKPDSHALVPGADGKIEKVLAGVASVGSPYVLSALPMALPEGSYTLSDEGLAVAPEQAALSWELGSYHFDVYKARPRASATLLLKPGIEAERGLATATAICAARDLINTPAEHMGPAELAAAAQLLAKQHGAKFKQIVGEELLKKGFPAVHAVGRASVRAPRLIELNWGKAKDPLISLVGKGVCFDTGGLNLKAAEGMRQMKKDMGGAANAIALASLIMTLKLPVRLQLLIPAVENAVAGNAYRPGDIIKTRKGLQIEIGNTDAEGRVILSDALAYASEGKPELIIDLATLTGAARVALGPQLPALFAKHMDTARELVDLGLKIEDPVWHMPLWAPYQQGIQSSLGDIVNTGPNPMAGAINAALFLEYFVEPLQDWLHLDISGSNAKSLPGRPEGGEAQGIRTLLAYLEERFGG
ncbi:leucyl aminopeptidase family protein [Mitsuaria sp. WAJ17]|uniref:leucyl aminopeptidase family protein n=1 Tax=Mitsuaria sp. WAJ17 TaxID=2761452 RepID=UPI00160063ED|nr:leucyl aminopeptidase family protein [Mitsuaria sp. WAJ17]MBB2487943.1 leucyl aminopeptidase family protein [Mitsuaria sp. WAJ17]